MKTLLVLGADAAASWLGNRLVAERIDGVQIYLDSSNSVARIMRLVSKGRIRITALVQIMFAEFFRRRKPFRHQGEIDSNRRLAELIREQRPERVLCFRCGLIIGREVLETGVPIMNVHVSSLPEYPGLGTIHRAIGDRAWRQDACLHEIDEGIDTGQVLMRKEYRLDPRASYRKNEDAAYLAGIELVIEFLQRGQTR